MNDIDNLMNDLKTYLGVSSEQFLQGCDELTLEIPASTLPAVARQLRDEPSLAFEQLLDVCGVDYLEYGGHEWRSMDATAKGFSRAAHVVSTGSYSKGRLAVVYHLLSLTHNRRLRLRAFAEGEPPIVPSLVEVWSSANWYEREAFDLFGILFDGHPDLRRILTDYGFIGHPFRKDFPLIGNVEMRYDATQKRVIYEAVSITPRVLVPKVIRDDNRYLQNTDVKPSHG
jgi:NADH-quinone oxidoreductase subunit C